MRDQTAQLEYVYTKNLNLTLKNVVDGLPKVCGGEPVIDRLRVTVRHLATLYLQGETIQAMAER